MNSTSFDLNFTVHNLSGRVEDLETGMGALKESLDVFFLVSMGSLVLFMQVGFVLQETGNYKSKHLINIFAKSLGDVCFGGLAFWISGYAFAFGTGNPFIGYEYFIAWDLPKPRYAQMFFQATFSASSSCLLTGAVAERMELLTSLFCSALINGFVYPVHTHWCWGPGGWLADRGFHDFAGSGVVHLAGGTWALVACTLVGRDKENVRTGKPAAAVAHSFPQIYLAYFIIIFGFLGFNGGSQGSISSPGDGGTVALVIIATLVSCCSGTITVLFVQRVRTAVNGGIVGMASVCCSCDGFYPWSACLTGSLAAVAYMSLAKTVEKLRIDDPLNTISTHVGGGLVGLLAGPILREGGVLSATNSADGAQMLLWNFVGLVCIVAWNGTVAIIVLSAFKRAGMLRISEECEEIGQDIVKHGDIAYPEWFDSIALVAHRSRELNSPSNLVFPGTTDNAQQRKYSEHPLLTVIKVSEVKY